MIRLPVLLILSLSFLMAQDGSFSYQGVSGCQICHKSAKKGNQVGAWGKGKHAKALEVLKSDQALKIAQEKGLAKPPSEAGECLVCHVTGWEQPGGYQVLTAEYIADAANARAVKKNTSKGNVGCESCHGPGSKYKSKKTMEGIFGGTIDPASVGLVLSFEKACLECHNDKSPTYKAFDFDKMVKEIAHPYTDEIKAQRKRK